MSMPRIRIRFNSNADEVIRRMEQNIQNALMKVGLFIEGEAKLRVPVDTGQLRGSIVHQVISDNEVQIGSDVLYAMPVEKGHSRHAAQPYLTPAAEDNIAEIQRIIISELSRL